MTKVYVIVDSTKQMVPGSKLYPTARGAKRGYDAFINRKVCLHFLNTPSPIFSADVEAIFDKFRKEYTLEEREFQLL